MRTVHCEVCGGYLHKAEEWKLIARGPKIKLMKEHGCNL